MRKLIIEAISTELNEKNSTVRLSFSITTANGNTNLWFETDAEFADTLADDRCDAAVVAVLPMVLREGYEVIESHVPISQKLYFNLRCHVIPQLLISPGCKSTSLDLKMDTTDTTFRPAGVGCGMSLGIDSFATLAEFGPDTEFPGAQITHLTYFNVGAHHGYDWRLGQSNLTSRQLYNGQLEKVRRFAKEFGYPLISVDSNMANFYHRFLGRSQFYVTHTYRNIATAMVLQRAIGAYHYSAAFNLDDFAISLDGSVANYEKWLLPHLSTGNIECYSSNRAWTRFEKTQLVCKLPSSFDFLTVCLVGIDNCGKCDKCRKTLMTLDVLGVLDKYAKSFDLEEYKVNDREKLFISLYPQLKRKGVYGPDMRDILNHALLVDFPHLVEPKLTETYGSAVSAVVGSRGSRHRKLPFLNAPVYRMMPPGTELSIVGTYGKWSKAIDGERTGFVWTANIRKGNKE